jgi:hypothetical protein
MPALVAPAIGVRLTSVWSMSAWTLLPVMLLSSPLVAIGRKDATRIVTVAAVFPLLMLAAAPAIGFAVHRAGPAADGHSSLLAEPLDQFWREVTNAPLKVFGSTDAFTYGVPFYLREHPIAVHVLERRATPEEEALIAKNGAAFACPITSIICVNVANARAAATLDAKRKEIEVRRSYLGNEGSSQRYLLVAIPPSGAASILTVPAISSALR